MPRKLLVLHHCSDPKVLPVFDFALLITGVFRCVDAEAYEVKRQDVSNGIFISFLKRHVCEDEKVTVMLDRVAEGRPLSQPWLHFLCHKMLIVMIIRNVIRNLTR